MNHNLPPDSSDAASHLEAGNQLARKRDYKTAAVHFRKVIQLKPDELQAYINLGKLAFVHTNYLQEGVAALQRAIELDPDCAEPYFMLAKLAEMSSNLNEAERYLQQGLRLAPEHPHSHRLYANILRRQGRIDEAISRLEAAPLPDNDNRLAIAVHFELGRLYERKQDSARAYAHFLQGNQLQSRASEARHVNKQSFIDQIDRIQRTFTPGWLATWSTPSEVSAGDRPAPVFLVGFPRSGTTLLDQILSSHPALQVIEEQPLLANIQNMLGSAADYPAVLASLSVSRIRELRQQYFADAARFLDPGKGPAFVDKLPLNIIHVGLMMRLFPGARIILALRHPCDACLSCFMQSFGYNDAMANFYTLDDAARLYARVMSLWRHYVELLPVNYHRIRYEDVVNDLEGEARRLLAFLNIEWDPGVLDYNQVARSRERIRTPSYEQVTEKIYTRARYRWQRYEEQLAPVMPVLAPFIEYFGY
jgi:tetratricopeptide (TPR) repeat protein